MRKLLISFLFLSCLQGCTTPIEVIEDRFQAGRHEGLAEEARRNGDEALARIHEDIVKQKK